MVCLFGGLVAIAAGDLIVKFKIGDPVEAFPVHGAPRTDGSKISALVVQQCIFEAVQLKKIDGHRVTEVW